MRPNSTSSTLATIAAIGVLGLAFAACGDNLTHPDVNAEFDAGIAAPLQCVPNLDGTITAAELQEVNGIPVKYLISESPEGMTSNVDLDGTVDSTGQLVWDWGTSYATDSIIQIHAAPLSGQWFAASFPGGTFVTPFDAGGTLQAIYHEDANAIWLHGLASTEENPPNGKTLYAYSDPIQVTEFPLSVGSSWTVTGTVVNGTLEGLPYASQDTYEISDDATGELILPDLTFTQVHRIRSKVTIDPAAGETVVTYQTSFYFECFGEVARATGQSNGTTADFTTAAEVRRLGL
ncbi:MAG: hypothetical protein ACLQVI_41800 [Polyangiaceae bacterium]